MGSVDNPKQSQSDTNMDDVLNSNMLNKAIELFQPQSQIRIKPKV